MLIKSSGLLAALNPFVKSENRLAPLSLTKTAQKHQIGALLTLFFYMVDTLIPIFYCFLLKLLAASLATGREKRSPLPVKRLKGKVT